MYSAPLSHLTDSTPSPLLIMYLHPIPYTPPPPSPPPPLPHSQQVVESCVEKLRKPDKAIFDITLNRLGVSAEEAVFLDDIGGNLKTAKQMGMATIKVQKDVLHVVKSTCPMLLLYIFTA